MCGDHENVEVSEYWQNVESNFDGCMKAIQSEERLINEIGLDISTAMKVTTGYSSAAQLIPGVKLSNKFRFAYEKSNIFFESSDWYYFVSDLEKLWANYQEAAEKPEDLYFSYYTLHCTECLGRKTICIDNCYTKLYLDQSCIENILKYRDLIAERIEILQAANFASEYDGFLRNILDVLERITQTSDNDMLLDTIKMMCKTTEPAFKYCLMECLHLVPEKILGDLEKIRYYHFPNSTW